MTTYRIAVRAGRRMGFRQRQIAKALGLPVAEMLRRLGQQIPPDRQQAAEILMALRPQLLQLPMEPISVHEPNPPEVAEVKDGLVLTRASDIKAEPIDWLWKGYIPSGTITILSGDPGLGKSQLTALVAAHVTTGRDWPDGSAGPRIGSAIMVGCEDDASNTVRPRLEAVGADLRRVHLLDGTRDRGATRRFDLVRDLAQLEDTLQALGDVGVIIVDPLNAFIEGVSVRDGDRIRATLTPLLDLAGRYNTTVVLILHHVKQAGRRGVHQVRGALDIPALSRSVLSVAVDPSVQGRKLLIPTKNNLAKAETLGFWIQPRTIGEGIETSAIVFDPEPVLDAEIQPAKAPSAVEQACAFLEDVLSDGPRKTVDVEDLAKEQGIAKKTLDNARRVLGVRASKIGLGGQWHLSLPKDANSAKDANDETDGSLRSDWRSSGEEAAE